MSNASEINVYFVAPTAGLVGNPAYTTQEHEDIAALEAAILTGARLELGSWPAAQNKLTALEKAAFLRASGLDQLPRPPEGSWADYFTKHEYVRTADDIATIHLPTRLPPEVAVAIPLYLKVFVLRVDWIREGNDFEAMLYAPSGPILARWGTRPHATPFGTMEAALKAKNYLGAWMFGAAMVYSVSTCVGLFVSMYFENEILQFVSVQPGLIWLGGAGLGLLVGVGAGLFVRKCIVEPRTRHQFFLRYGRELPA